MAHISLEKQTGSLPELHLLDEEVPIKFASAERYVFSTCFC